MKILIPNATGPTNLGDQAMLEALLDLIGSTKGKRRIIIHTKNPELYERKYASLIAPSIYQYIALENKSIVIRSFRFLRVCMNVFVFSNTLNVSKMLSDYKEADVVIFAGGGYLRSGTGITQTFNLFLQLLPFAVAKKMNKAKLIVAPISFGPFAHAWQAALSAKVLSGCQAVSVREEKSYALLKSHRVKNLLLLNDLALQVKRSKRVNNKKNIVGFTIRNWLHNKVLQEKLEFSYASALARLSKRTGLTIQPIIQVASPDFPFEDDKEAVRRVYNQISRKDVPLSVPIKLKSVDHAAHTYGSLDLLLGMRMHSNILAATQGVPFVAVSYEHKTEGIAKQIGMEAYCISQEAVDKDKLFKLLMKAYANRKHLKAKLASSIDRIRTNDEYHWGYLLSI